MYYTIQQQWPSHNSNTSLQKIIEFSSFRFSLNFIGISSCSYCMGCPALPGGWYVYYVHYSICVQMIVLWGGWGGTPGYPSKLCILFRRRWPFLLCSSQSSPLIYPPTTKKWTARMLFRVNHYYGISYYISQYYTTICTYIHRVCSGNLYLHKSRALAAPTRQSFHSALNIYLIYSSVYMSRWALTYTNILNQ